MSTPSLTDFLLARIAEDGRAAQKLAATDRRPVMSLASTVNHPQRILLECEAKRRIVDWAAPLVSGVRHENEDGRDLLCLLALPYADHPDYREEWRV